MLQHRSLARGTSRPLASVDDLSRRHGGSCGRRCSTQRSRRAAARPGLFELDAVTGEALIGATVENALQRLELPPLSLDLSQPIVLQDATVQDPEAFGQATLTSLVDGTEVTFDLNWGLVVDFNGGLNPACDPILETVYGPLD